MGGRTAESIGLYKEHRDANGGTGFSLVDYQADLAGIAFAKELTSGRRSLARLQDFAWPDFLPESDGLVEGLTQNAFDEQFGSLTDARFLSQRARILERLKKLPGLAGKNELESGSGPRGPAVSAGK